MFYEEKPKGIIIRARARWCEHGEKSTKYFLRLEKGNHIKKHMRKLTINESVTTDSFTILSEQKRFYQNLYKSGRNESDDRYAAKSFLNNLIISKLSEEEKRSCEGLFFDGGFECSTARNLAYSLYCVFNEAVFISSLRCVVSALECVLKKVVFISSSNPQTNISTFSNHPATHPTLNNPFPSAWPYD